MSLVLKKMNWVHQRHNGQDWDYAFWNFKKNEPSRKGTKLFVKGTCINGTFPYKYPGIDLEPNQNVRSYFDKTYKRAAGRVNLLRSIRPPIDQKCTERIYNTMILSIFTYCGSLGLVWPDTLKSLIKNVEQQSVGITGNSSLKHPSVENTIKCKSGQLVFDCLLDNLCSPFKSYFERLDHFKSTKKMVF